MNRTKIICTAGPSVDTPAQIEALVKNGMSVFRINCSHGTHAQYDRILKIVRGVEKKLGQTIAIMIDLQGPKLRVGDLPQPFTLRAGETWTLSGKGIADEKKKIIPIKIPDFAQSVAVGGKIFMDDGLIEVEVAKKLSDAITVKVLHGGHLNSRKGMNIPFYRGKLSAITAKDRADLVWGLGQNVDIVALSFVREAKDIVELKRLIGKRPTDRMPLTFAKIEKPEAVDNLEAIMLESDGILVARGDLGIELQQEKVPVVQKLIIEMCRKHKKPNIVATQMLDSMRFNPIPTRAEVSDVANTIFSAADAVLLTGETSSGKYPIEACATMNRIIGEVEGFLSGRSIIKRESDFNLSEYQETFLFHAIQMADKIDVRAIVMLTKQGQLIKVASKFHPKQPIYAMAPTMDLARKLAIYWGVHPISLGQKLVEARMKAGTAMLKSQKVVKKGDRLLFIYRDYKSDDLNLKVTEV